MIKNPKQTVLHLQNGFIKSLFFYFLNVVFNKPKLMRPIIYNLMYKGHILALYTLYIRKKRRLNNAKQRHFLVCTNIGNAKVIFETKKNQFIYFGTLKTTVKNKKEEL